MSIKNFSNWVFIIVISSILSFGGRLSFQLDEDSMGEAAGVAAGVGVKVWAAGIGGEVWMVLHLVHNARMRAQRGDVGSSSPIGRNFWMC